VDADVGPMLDVHFADNHLRVNLAVSTCCPLGTKRRQILMSLLPWANHHAQLRVERFEDPEKDVLRWLTLDFDHYTRLYLLH